MEQRTKGDVQLSGVSVLVVEDDLLILMELESVLSDAGAQIVGCRSVEAAHAHTDAEGLSVALLDLQLGRQSILPVARDLTERGIPLVFYTGQVNLDQVRSEWPRCKIVQKPAPARAIVAAIADVVRAAAQRQSAAP